MTGSGWAGQSRNRGGEAPEGVIHGPQVGVSGFTRTGDSQRPGLCTGSGRTQFKFHIESELRGQYFAALGPAGGTRRGARQSGGYGDLRTCRCRAPVLSVATPVRAGPDRQREDRCPGYLRVSDSRALPELPGRGQLAEGEVGARIHRTARSADDHDASRTQGIASGHPGTYRSRATTAQACHRHTRE